MKKLEVMIEALRNTAGMLDAQRTDGDLYLGVDEWSEADQAKYGDAISQIISDLYAKLRKLQARQARQRAKLAAK